MFEPQPGMRVVIRYSDGGQLTDALGSVLAADADSVTVDSKRGPVRIDRSSIELAHEIPPAPQRPGPVHSTVSTADLRRISAQVWLPGETVWLNRDAVAEELSSDEGAQSAVESGWLLRAAPGADARANSALVLTDPQFPAEEALGAVQKWYADRDLHPALQIFSAGAQGELDSASAQVSQLLRPAGFTPSDTWITMTAPAREAAGAAQPPQGLEIVQSDRAHAVHLSAWGHDDTEDVRALVHSAPQVIILSAVAVHPDGSKSLVGAVRLAVASKWGWLDNLVVNPQLRRRGAGRALVQAAARLAAVQGIRSLGCDVPAANEDATALLSSLGFAEHHRFWFAVQNDAAQNQGA
ncbi:N-acetyltransferase [Brevibacterium sp. HMSC063G07]|uniref:GNAT family N-acetyltransferase n=1 Tax=Brevibacterium sp. HMSC063G07 TaxID=1739261 RepID=UPI0008A5C2FD|nr:GNAT family N-acetyltransferase [Brevibacterium sp. HMSC063G07]OFL65252.1 hypothetical protein HMPREF2757_05095 [Brevibacterium sp. HMSC063G07]